MQVLTAEDIGRIHEASLDVLANTGIWYHGCPEAIALFKAQGAQVDGDNVRMPRRLVEEALKCVPPREELKFCLAIMGFARPFEMGKGRTQFAVVGNPYYIYDYERRAQRNCAMDDQDDQYMILDHLRNFQSDMGHFIYGEDRLAGTARIDLKQLRETEVVDIATPGYQTSEECSRFLQQRVLARIGVRDRKVKAGAWLPLRCNNRRSPEAWRLEVLAVMALQGVPRTMEMLRQCDQGFVWCNPISPLQFHPGEAEDIIRVSRYDGPRFIMVSPEVMIGATGPITLAGSLLQNNAEVLGGAILAQLARPGTPVIYGCVSAIMDMRNTQIAQGNFEAAMFNAAAVQMADFYGLPSRISPGNPSDRQPSARSAAEAVFGIYTALSSGANIVTTGLLDSTLMTSYEHLVLMDELIDHMRCAAHGIDTSDLGAEMAEIARHGHPSPGFISSDYTLQNLRKDTYYSDYMGRSERSYQDWYDQAHAQVKRILSERQAPPRPDAETLERLAAVQRRLQEDNLTWRRGSSDWWALYTKGDWWAGYVQDFA